MMMKTASDFAHFFVTDLVKDLKRLETRRKAVLGKVKILVAVTVALVGLVVAVVAAFRLDPMPAFVAIVVCLGAASGLYKLLLSGYVHDFKTTVIWKTVKFIDPGLVYTPGGHISAVEINSSRIFTRYPDRVRGDDLVEGRIGDIDIKFSEVHAEHKTESADGQGNRRNRYRTIFRGLFFVGDFNKRFYGKTVVLPDCAERLLGGVGSLLQSLNRSRGEVMRMDDPEFEELFVVYGDDQIESRYVLSTSLMGRIVDFRKKTGKQVCLSFVGSQVFVAIPYRRPLFEPSVLSKVTTFKGMQEHFENLNLALGIVGDLNLNTRIWAGPAPVGTETAPAHRKDLPRSVRAN
jgi:hypothetical protein